MAPEKVSTLVVLDLRLIDGVLMGNGERIELANEDLYVSWYMGGNPTGYTPILGGLVHVYDAPGLHRTQITQARVTRLRDGYRWRDPPPDSGPMMFAMVLPKNHSLGVAKPQPVEAKAIDGRVAAFWLLPEGEQVELLWNLDLLEETGLDQEVERINQGSIDAMLASRSGVMFRYDVALSFAGEDREYVEKVAKLLADRGIRVFYDRFEEADLWGKNLYDHLSKVYEKFARYTVMFISKHYASKAWTGLERQSAQARAFSENAEYILPARFDDTEVPGLPKTVAYISLHGREPSDLVARIAQKLESRQ